MYILYCLIASFMLSIIYEFSGLNGLRLHNVFLSFLLFFLINLLISNPKKKYKRNIIFFSIIITVLAVCNTSKVAFQLAEISFFDTKLAKAAGDIAGLFISKLPYLKVVTILIFFIILLIFTKNYKHIINKYNYTDFVSNKSTMLDDIFSKKIVKLIVFVLFMMYFIFVSPITKVLSTSSFGNFLISGKSLIISYYDEHYVNKADTVDGLIKQIKKDKLSNVDKKDKLLAAYPYNKQTDMDVIIIQSETFFDIYAHQDKLGKNGINIHEDITKNFRYYQKNGISGLFNVPTVGGGTVNTEYEVLTGYGAKYFAKGSMVFTSVLKQPTNSLATYMKNYMENVKTIGIHNHNADYWDRDKVYPRLSIDKFIDMTMFTKEEQEDLVGAWMSDKTIFDMTKRQLEENPNTNNFILSVTVQNHGPFLGTKGEYITTDNMNGQDAWELNNFVANIKYSDEQLKIFMDYINSRKKPTMVIFYGDHKPDPRYSIFKESNYYQENENINLFNTDYFIYFNDAVKDEKLNALKGTRQDISSAAMNRYIQMLLGDTSPISMYIYNYQKNPENYFDKNVISGVIDSNYRELSLKFINNIIDYKKLESN